MKNIVTIGWMFVALVAMGYGFAYMVGGPALGTRYLNRIRNMAMGFVRWIGRVTAEVATHHPFLTGCAVITLILFLTIQSCK